MPSRNNDSLQFGLTFHGGRYATIGETNGEIMIVVALKGTSVSTGIPCEDVKSIINDTNNTYFAIQYKTERLPLLKRRLLN